MAGQLDWGGGGQEGWRLWMSGHCTPWSCTCFLMGWEEALEPSLARGRQKELRSLLLSNLTRCVISVPMQPGGTGTSWDSGSPLHLEQT